MKLNTARNITKIVANIFVGLGTTKITAQVIANNIDQPEKTFEKVQIAAASAVVGTMAVERTRSWTDAKIDTFYDRWAAAGTKPEPETTDQP